MNEIVRHIEYLLVTADCVTIPGLGAILANSMPASYSQDKQLLLPPSRFFSFNPSLTHNDGLLVSSIARSESISFEAAARFVDKEVESMKKLLAATGRLKLGRVGAIALDADNKMSFETNSSSVLSPDCLWLPALEIKTLTQLNRSRNDALSERRSQNLFGRVARIAASVAVLIALGFILATPVKIDNAQYASLGLEDFKPVAKKSDDSLIRRPGESSAPLVLVVSRASDSYEIADTVSHNEYIRRHKADKPVGDIIDAETDGSSFRFDENDAYRVVIASLASEKEADDFIAGFADIKLGILAKDGRYRVYAATGSDNRQAQLAAAELADKYPGAWVCRK